MFAVGELTVTMELQPRGPAGAFVLSEEQVQTIGEGARRFPARVVTASGAEVRGTITRMGGEFLFGMSRAVRQQTGVEIGDTVTFTITLDEAPREVEVPTDLAAALDDDPKVRAAFDGLAFTHRKEFARWVAEAKRPETRQRRVAQAVEMVREGRTRS
jgi:hypothetical protein